ncbi:MAG: sugar phosphate isomerase/epimerase [Chitinophagaceae bacterium]|nr:sugar phosphate isomerase/epimerase [Chitinophagaceae bacterium]
MVSCIISRFAAIAVILILSFTQSAAQPEIGVQLYSFRNQIPKDVAGMLKKIREMGIKELEGGGTYGLPFTDYKKILDDNGFKMISIGADFNKLQTNLPAIINEAKSFGASYVTCFWIPHKGDEFTLDDVKKAVEVFNAAGKTLKENGLSLCYHPHGYEFRPHENGTLFDYLINNMDARYANFEMDVFWIKHPGQDPVALLKKYPNRFLLMHLKDRKPGTEGNQFGRADVETNVVLGTGDVGIAEIMKVAKKAGVKHFFIEDESSRSMEQVPQSLAYLKKLK